MKGRSGVEGNERVDREAKEATKGRSSRTRSLPSFLTEKDLPKSITAQRQMYDASLMERWWVDWATSPWHGHIFKIDSGMPSQGYRKLVTELSWMQTSILTQFRMGHIPLQKYLH